MKMVKKFTLELKSQESTLQQVLCQKVSTNLLKTAQEISKIMSEKKEIQSKHHQHSSNVILTIGSTMLQVFLNKDELSMLKVSLYLGMKILNLKSSKLGKLQKTHGSHD